MSSSSPRSAASSEAASLVDRVSLVLLALAMGGFAIGVTEFAAMSVLPQFARTFDLNDTQAGYAVSIYALGVVVGAPILAVLGARIPRWKLLIGFMTLFACGNLLTALSGSYEAMLVFRFLSGLPHGAYFGVGALVAVSLVSHGKRARAVAVMMFGLTGATIVGVPLATYISHLLDWRWAFVLSALLALATAVMVWRFAPRDTPRRDVSPWKELDALKNSQVWLTLAMGSIGFGGVFAVYSYLASTLESISPASPALTPWVFGVFGLGMTAGTFIGAWGGDRFGIRAAAGVLIWGIAVLAIYPFAVGNVWAMAGAAFLVGTLGALGPILQTRLMDVAGDAQTLAAALNHSAFNIANALGPYFVGLALYAGYDYSSAGWVGVGLSLGGLLLWVWAMADARRVARNRAGQH